ncbi:MAG: hypothetical protein K2L13_02490 [Opitutales bacterium]|nr:hypothetical protein [Opitutales bacterium]
MDTDDLDLEGLKNFSFQPAWSRPGKDDFDKGDRRKDRRFKREMRDSGDFDGDEKDGGRARSHFRRRSSNSFRGKDGKNGKNFVKDKFQPVVEVEFYPEDAQFETIINACRLTCKTYELFSVARLFLEKPERFVMVVKKVSSQKDPNLYLSVDDGFIFLDEKSAIQYVLDNHLDKYFNTTEEVGEAPKGTFVCVHKCGITGKILCPPNYHKYQEILLEHYDKYLSNIPFEKFKSKIESVNGADVIEAWKAEASKTIMHSPKLDGHEEKFTKFAEVKRFFIENFKDQAIRVANSFRITGLSFMSMPRGILSKSIFSLLMQEKRFPLGFSNNLRGKLRRAHFTIYKVQSGKSKIACICAVRRKFRAVDDKFEGEIQVIIDYIDNHPNVKISELYKLLYPDAPEHIIGESDEMFSNFAKDLNWLIREGYVSEFEDGRLVSTAIMTKEQLDAMKKSEKMESVANDEVKADDLDGSSKESKESLLELDAIIDQEDSSNSILHEGHESGDLEPEAVVVAQNSDESDLGASPSSQEE